MTVWIMRGGSDRGLHEWEFIASGTIGINFGVYETARRPDDELRREIEWAFLLWNEERGIEMDGSRVDGVVSRFLNQVRSFRDDVQPGDTVIMPRKKSRGHMVRRGQVYPH